LSETQLPRFKNTTWNYNYVDYRNQEIVTPVKNQGLCASDYAFAGLAALESAYVSKTGDNKILSEQEIIDCSYGMYDDGRMNQGCTQGLPQYALEYANKYALSAAGDYPYVGKQQVCKVKTPTIEGQFKYQQLLADNEDHLAYLLEKNGPVIVYVCDGPSFGLYS
jgi:C1A family cysteine protease